MTHKRTHPLKTIFVNLRLILMAAISLNHKLFALFYIYIYIQRKSVFSLISIESDYHNEVFVYVYGQRIRHQIFLCFSPDFVAYMSHFIRW